MGRYSFFVRDSHPLHHADFAGAFPTSPLARISLNTLLPLPDTKSCTGGGPFQVLLVGLGHVFFESGEGAFPVTAGEKGDVVSELT